MAYIKITSGKQELYSIGRLRKDNPNVSFPEFVSDQTLADYGVYPVVTAEKPNFDSATQVCSYNEVATEVDGQWTYGWTVREKTQEEKQEYVNALADKARNKRNTLLSVSDWTQIADAPVDQAAWATYRQALRDVPQQTGFPHEVDWPVKP